MKRKFFRARIRPFPFFSIKISLRSHIGITMLVQGKQLSLTVIIFVHKFLPCYAILEFLRPPEALTIKIVSTPIYSMLDFKQAYCFT